MTAEVLFSEDVPPFDWSEAVSNKIHYGPKGSMLAAIPRTWTLPFVLVPASVLARTDESDRPWSSLSEAFFSRVQSLAQPTDKLIIRSSVIGESIWDRGTYESVTVDNNPAGFTERLSDATRQVRVSAQGKPTALVIQRYLEPRSRGEFGNLLRVSKTRDQWELSTVSHAGLTSRIRFNTQRDEAASPKGSLRLKSGQSQQRLFGSIGAWLNNYLLRGRSQRLNCEWLADHEQVYIVQTDEEDEDYSGVNPFQLLVSAAHTPRSTKGAFLTPADHGTLETWDKLKVLDELWEPEASHKPTLFSVPLSTLPAQHDSSSLAQLENDFHSLIGADSIVVRTSVRAGSEKEVNLPRTECIGPREAASWCFQMREEFRASGKSLGDLAFIAHRFIASRASAWIRAEPNNPVVEIHSLWGLPDALQYCPYDIWEVHVPTEVATEYSEYKSNILIPREDGEWEYVRVKNELARNLCLGRRDAIDLAKRSAAIAQRIGRPCHIMWFIGCVDEGGEHFSIPWYWTEAHEAEKNRDRSNYQIMIVSDHITLDKFITQTAPRVRQAIELRPAHVDSMRDPEFIDAVGKAAREAGVPVILAGSTLAHAYYQLRRQGCTVVPLGEKEHSRIRRAANFGKLVRDKIPRRIAQRQEAEVTRLVPNQLVKGFLTSKILEEALELRNAEGLKDKVLELADLFEVLRAMAKAEGVALNDIIIQADKKREKAGGFDHGLILMQTGILGRTRDDIAGPAGRTTQVLARRLSGESYEIPFSFFGFMEMDQPRSLVFDDLGVRLDVVLKSDRLELRLSREAEQLEMSLDLAIPDSDAER